MSYRSCGRSRNWECNRHDNVKLGTMGPQIRSLAWLVVSRGFSAGHSGEINLDRLRNRAYPLSLQATADEVIE